MAASHIPNLSTLRSAHGNNPSSGPGRGRGQGRGRGRGRWRDLPRGKPPYAGAGEEQDEGEGGKNSDQAAAAKARIIQMTDQDASISRWSAVQAGYLRDPYARLLTPSSASRRLPIINRGTYVRTTAIDNLVSLFLSQSPSVPKQIISIGAGSDTRFFRLFPSSPSQLIYHELDFAPNTAAKIATITSSPALLQQIPPPLSLVSSPPDAAHSPNYHIHSIDLRALDADGQNPSTLDLVTHIKPRVPTLLISECCLCYLPPADAEKVVTFFTKHIFPRSTPLGLLLYEPINPSDAFGRVMEANLAARGIEMHILASLDAQRDRLRKYGFGKDERATEESDSLGDDGRHEAEAGANADTSINDTRSEIAQDKVNARGSVRARDIDHWWETSVTTEEKQRVAELEMVDEVEEWKLLAQHYCVAWGWRDGTVEGDGGGDGAGDGAGDGGGEAGTEKKADGDGNGEGEEEGEEGEREEKEEEKKDDESEAEKEEDREDIWKKWRYET